MLGQWMAYARHIRRSHPAKLSGKKHYTMEVREKIWQSPMYKINTEIGWPYMSKNVVGNCRDSSISSCCHGHSWISMYVNVHPLKSMDIHSMHSRGHTWTLMYAHSELALFAVGSGQTNNYFNICPRMPTAPSSPTQDSSWGTTSYPSCDRSLWVAKRHQQKGQLDIFGITGRCMRRSIADAC